jgi:hypothetical protein
MFAVQEFDTGQRISEPRYLHFNKSYGDLLFFVSHVMLQNTRPTIRVLGALHSE